MISVCTLVLIPQEGSGASDELAVTVCFRRVSGTNCAQPLNGEYGTVPVCLLDFHYRVGT